MTIRHPSRAASTASAFQSQASSVRQRLSLRPGIAENRAKASVEYPAEVNTPRTPTMIKQVMTRDVISVSPDTRVGEIASLLLSNRISAVPVVNDVGRLIGIVSEGDLVRRS
jgi:CBS-domain-containing membrane protein